MSPAQNKVAVVGSRTFGDYETLCKVLDEVGVEIGGIDLIVSGGAKGADSLSERYAEEHDIPTLIFIPDWEKHGRVAGMIRNSDIIEAATHGVAFWDGHSRGTNDSIKKLTKAGKYRRIMRF